MDSRLRLIVRAVVLIALARCAQAETDSQTQAVIRGTGKDVTIVYRSSVTTRSHTLPAAPHAPTPAVADDTVLTEAAQMKTRGASDESIIAYLRIHQAELPTVVSTETVDQLRQAGVGRPVIASLSTLTAVEIGELGEGAVVMTAPPSGSEDLGWDGGGYPGGGYYGYGSGGFLGWGGRVGRAGRFIPDRHPFFPAFKIPAHFSRPTPVHSAHMAMGRSMGTHAGLGTTRTR